MNDFKMHTPDLTHENLARLRELFPGVVTETRNDAGDLRFGIDLDQLRQELSDHVVEGPQERYQLNWPGKRDALLAANAPIAKTLRPVEEESHNFYDTRNLFIEGDNLDALKLLQESFLGRIKLIYLDPPYNRKKGNNLVYRDDFVGNTFEYMKQSNQANDVGSRLVANSEANGRFHSDWLSMMYSRLRVAKNLLAPNGVIMISIDDSETANVLHLCYEIFGEANFVGTVIWKNATDNNPSNIAVEHESIHVFAKSKSDLEGTWKSSVSDIKDVLLRVGQKLVSEHKDSESLQKAYTTWFRENKSQLGQLDRYKYIDEGGVYTGSQSVHNPGKEGYRYDVLHPETKLACKEPLMGYRFPKETMDRLLSEGRILFGEDEDKIIELKVYAAEFDDKFSSVFDLDGRTGPYDLKALFPEGKKVFSNPKPVALLERLVAFATGPNDICMDLFGGSSTLAHAVMELGHREGGRRQFISVQYPEEIGQENKDAKEAYDFCRKAGLKPFVSEISKERIRRAGASISKSAGHEAWSGDVGFRVLKVDSSNFEDVYYRPDELGQADLLAAVENIKPGRSAEDLLFQILVDWGVDVALPIRRDVVQGKTIFSVDGNALIACLDKGITDALVKELAALQPLRLVFRDNGFDSDADKINAEQIVRQLSPGTDVKAI